VWWKTVNNIRESVWVLDRGLLTDNISCKVRDGYYTLFWKDFWLDGGSLEVRFHRLFELNKLVMVANTFTLGGK